MILIVLMNFQRVVFMLLFSLFEDLQRLLVFVIFWFSFLNVFVYTGIDNTKCRRSEFMYTGTYFFYF